MAIVVVVAASVAPLAANAKSRTEIGYGMATCGAWTTDEDPNGRVRQTRAAWILGYLSRASYDHAGDMLDPVDAPAIEAWIDNYCKAHPLDRLSRAAEALEVELAARVANKK